jgi:hypothetical protein
MIRKPLIIGAATLLAFALVAVGSNANVRATHIVGGAMSMAVDADPTGNTATSLGARDPCVETTAGSDVDVDVTILSIPAGNPMIGFGYSMTYDPAVLSVTASDTSSKLLGSAPSSAAAYFGEELPDTDGGYDGAGLDISANTSSQESGSGVLERLTITVDPGAATGGYALHLIEAAHVNPASLGFDSGLHASAQIAVGVSCGSLPAVEPRPAMNGDVDCSNTVTSVDALKILRNNAGLTVTQIGPEPDACIDVGSNNPHVGDVDCGGSVTSVDALKILRKNAGLPVTYTEPCDDIGA